MPTVTLAPLGLGELLDKTFSTFRKHFWLLAGVMVLPEGLLVGLNVLVQVYMSGIMPPPSPHSPPSPQVAAQSTAFAMRAGSLFLGILIPYFIVYAMALGASTYALSEVYLGRVTTIRESYRIVANKFWRLLHVIFSILFRSFGLFFLGGILLVFMIAAVAPLFRTLPWIAALVGLIALLGMLISGILVIIFLMRYSVAVPALVLEGLKAGQALKRSVSLTKGYLWRLLLVAVLMTLIRMTLVSLCQAPFSVAAFLLMYKGGRPSLWLTIPSLLVGGVAGAATAPLLMVSFAIAYYDLRVRKEGFDLQLMMANLSQNNSPGASAQGQGKEVDRLENSGVFGAVFWTIVTGGIYQAIWFLTRRKALNSLHSPEKLGMAGLSVALVGFIASFCLPIVGSVKWGSWVEAENVLGPLHPLILLIAEILIVVQCFKARRILVDHLTPREEAMFSASIRIQNDELISRAGTFFLGIFYLQFKINALLNWLTADEGGQAEENAQGSLASLPPAVNS
jgi:hypothetical protein